MRYWRRGADLSERNELVERALAYPYEAPARPFVQAGHRTLGTEELPVDPAERVAVLAYGSNAAPVVLSRKLSLSDQPVLVVPARLAGFDVVYSAHISPYGAIPANLQRSPGTTVHVHVIYMTEAQVGLISATEPNYELTELQGLECLPSEGDPLTELHAYVSRHGCLLAGEAELALAAVSAEGRAFAQLGEPQVLEHVRRALAPDESLEAFVLANVTDPDLSQARTAQLPRRPLEAASNTPPGGGKI